MSEQDDIERGADEEAADASLTETEKRASEHPAGEPDEHSDPDGVGVETGLYPAHKDDFDEYSDEW